MSRRVVSFAWGRGLGHVSRLIAVHSEVRRLGWESLLLTERPQRLVDDYGLPQIVVPTDADSLVGEPLLGAGPAVDHRVARALVAETLRAGDVVLHDVTVQRELYDEAERRGSPQFLVHRFQRNRPDPALWAARHVPALRGVYLLGAAPGPDLVRHGVRLVSTPPVLRRLLGTDSPWPGDAGPLRVAVVAGGGGHADAAGFLSAALGGIAGYGRRAAVEGLDVLVVTGPHFDGQVVVPDGLPGPVRVTPYLGPGYDPYRHATVAVTHAGYNTVQELAHARVPAVVVPGVRDFDDQRVHLRAAAARLNAIVVQPDAKAVADALPEAMRAGRPASETAPHPVPDGAAYIARDLVESS
ncbi:glycosyltransferase [Actinomadura sp. 9N215]|uniref:glycosyltransferase n=1 Tax=Actinomadura sp. 9N215 TaxID=3375150 RepID=UPI0037A9AB66